MSDGLFNVAVLVGSLRRQSWSRKTAAALADVAPDQLRLEVVEIGDLALYDEDLDGDDPPPAWTRFRARMGRADAVLFVTPEYNRSIPGALKNALDVGSRPQGASVFAGLPAGVVSVTPSQLGAFGANHALRQTFVFLDMPVMQQPEAYIANIAGRFGDDGSIDGDTGQFLASFMSAFAQWDRDPAPIGGSRVR